MSELASLEAAPRSLGPAPSSAALGRELFRLALPAVAVSLLQTLVFLADRLCLGRYSESALASMQLQGPLLWSLWGVFTGLLVGTVPLVARAVGAGDLARAAAVGRTALRLSFALGVGVAVLGLAFLEPLVRLLGPASDELRVLSTRYLLVALCGFPSMFVATTAAFVLNAAGDTRAPLRAGLVSNIVNVVLNLLLIFGAEIGPLHVPELGVTGAAIGSSIAFTVEAGLLLAVLGQGSRGLVITRPWRAGDPGVLRELLVVSGPALVERVVLHGGYLAYSMVITALGALVMAGNQALVTIESVCFLSAEGFGVAAATLVGQSLGRGRPEAAKRAGWLAASWCAVVLSALGVVIFLVRHLAAGAFVPSGSDGGALVSTTVSAMPWLVLSQPFMACGVVLAQALRGAGDTRSPLISAVLSGAILRVGLAYWLGVEMGLGIHAVWIASCCDWVCRTLLLAGVWWRGHWMR